MSDEKEITQPERARKQYVPGRIYKEHHYKQDGYLIFDSKFSGLFFYRDEGEYKGKMYLKIRTYMAYITKNGLVRWTRKSIAPYDKQHGKTFERIGFDPSIVPQILKILVTLYNEITDQDWKAPEIMQPEQAAEGAEAFRQKVRETLKPKAETEEEKVRKKIAELGGQII